MVAWQPGMTLEMAEKAIILHAYDVCFKNQTHTATMLGISVRNLHDKLKKYEEDASANKAREEQRAKQVEEESRKARFGASGRPQLQSDSEFPKELPLPVRKSEEVQKVLPAQRSASNQKRIG
jgi:hypothetical protein